MKYIKLLAISFIFLVSCQKSFIALTPQSAVTTDAFFKSAADAITAVNGCYSSLSSGSQYGQNFQSLMEDRGDNTLTLDISGNSGTNYKLAHFTDDPSNDILYSSWVSLYHSIFRCNTVLDNITQISMDNGLKNRLKGEAQFIRALAYFNLVRLWGNVPLITTTVSVEQAYTLKRNDIAAVYKQAEADLQFAAANLPAGYTGADIGRVTSGAANGLLGKVYLYEKKYTDANTVLQAVINSNSFSLLPNIADVFSPAKKYNAEILFAVRYASGITGRNHGFWYTNGNNLPTVDSSIIKAYTINDARKTLTDPVKPVGLTFTGPRKFMDAPDASKNSGLDFPVLRFADVLLMQAEVLNEQAYNPGSTNGTAFYYLNMVRQRAGLATLSATDLPDQASFRAEVYKQRRLELPFECDRWFDLVRTGQAIEAIQADVAKAIPLIQPYRFIYPIPQSELSIVNNPAIFPQNPGY